MDKSGWHIPGSYLLLSAAVYLSLGILLQPSAAEEALWLAMVAAVNLVAQGIFAALIRPTRYLAPISPWRLALSSLQAGALLAPLTWALLATLGEARLVPLPDDPLATGALLLTPGLLGAVGLYTWFRRGDRLAVLARMGSFVGAVALAVLVVVVPTYLVAVRPHPERHLHGNPSVLAICIALFMLAWSLGPLLLFLHVRQLRRQLRDRCPACGYDLHDLSQMRCPECGRAFTLEEVHATAEELRITGDGAKG